MEVDYISLAKKVITDGLALLPEDARGEWKASASDIFVDEAIGNAVEALKDKDDPEKVAMLRAYAVQEANRMASTLWRLEVLTDELEKEYRKLPKMDEVVKPYNGFLAKRAEREKALNEQAQELQREKREMDIFMGIINGIPAEESEQRYEEFKNAQQQALGAR